MQLVTGGAGFIGSNYIHYILGKHPNEQVICLDALTYAGNLTSLSDALQCPRLHFVHADIADPHAVEAVFARYHPDVVVNFAAESHVDRSIDQPMPFVRTNVLGTAQLLDAALRHGVKRFHQVSTDEVYGDLPLEGEQCFVEGDVLRPSSPYSASKASADLLVLAYHRTFGLPVTVSRAGNNYGPYQFPEKLIPLCITHAVRGQPTPVYGTGANVREWLHVEDHCRAIDHILAHGREGEVYNVGGETRCDNLSLVRTILRLTGAPDTLWQYVADRKGHDRRYALDCTKLRALGWRPTVPFDEGLSDTVHWYLTHEAWCRAIQTGKYRNVPIPTDN